MNTTAQIIPFEFHSATIRTCADEKNKPWFCATDVCAVLGYANNRKAIADNCRKAGVTRSDIRSGGQKRRVTFINEGNLYRLIIKSRKPEAEEFEGWVCDEVLPTIRKQGHYHDAEGKMGTLIGQTIGTDGFHMLGALIKGKVVNLPTVVQRRATAKLWAQTHAAFGVRSAADIPADQLDAARNFVAAYAIEGEYLGCLEEDGARLSNDQLMHLNALAVHMDWSWRIFQRHRLYEHLTGLGSQAGIEMIDHLKDGALHGGILQRQLGPQIESARHH